MRKCSCCGNDDDVQMHHLYPKSQGCPNTLMVPLCYTCHREAHGLKTSLNHSELTRAGLAAAKARGTKLGWAIPSRAEEVKAAVAKGAASTAEAADTFAAKILPMVRPLAEAGQSLRQIAAALNRQGIATPRGKEWQATSVKNLIDRTVAMKERT